MIRALLHDLLLSFQSDDPRVLAGWQKLFDVEIAAADALPHDARPDVSIAVAVTTQLPQPPADRPSYDEQPGANRERSVRFYDSENGGLLDLARPAQISFNFDDSLAGITLTRRILDTGNLEDITMIALAPFLRRRGAYMAHAFAVAAQTAVLLSGPSGSGKTTTGLALIEAGWTYLANDVTLLRHDANGVEALQSPGAINLHPHTLTLLPALQDRLTPSDTVEASGKYVLPRTALLAETQLATAAPVSAILFPTITAQKEATLHQLPRAIGMARLVEEGVDQWDKQTYEDHVNLLALLSHQVDFFELRLPDSRLVGHKPLFDLLNRRFSDASAA